MKGLIDESGRLPGLMKFAGDGLKPKGFFPFGNEKSFISLFMMIPVMGSISRDPKRRLTVLVSETAMPKASAVDTCEVPGLHG